MHLIALLGDHGTQVRGACTCKARRAVQSLVSLMAEEDAETLKACWEALGAVGASVPKEVQPSYVRCVKDAVGTARDKERRRHRAGPHLLPGFCLPKALAPVLPFYLQGVLQARARPSSMPRAAEWCLPAPAEAAAARLHGIAERGLAQGSSAELRELAADGLGELLEATSEESLRPFTVQITGARCACSSGTESSTRSAEPQRSLACRPPDPDYRRPLRVGDQGGHPADVGAADCQGWRGPEAVRAPAADDVPEVPGRPGGWFKRVCLVGS